MDVLSIYSFLVTATQEPSTPLVDSKAKISISLIVASIAATFFLKNYDDCMDIACHLVGKKWSRKGSSAVQSQKVCRSAQIIREESAIAGR